MTWREAYDAADSFARRNMCRARVTKMERYAFAGYGWCWYAI